MLSDPFFVGYLMGAGLFLYVGVFLPRMFGSLIVWQIASLIFLLAATAIGLFYTANNRIRR